MSQGHEYQEEWSLGTILKIFLAQVHYDTIFIKQMKTKSTFYYIQLYKPLRHIMGMEKIREKYSTS